MSFIDRLRRRQESGLDRLSRDFDEHLRQTLHDEPPLRTVPAVTQYAPRRAEYSVERVQSFFAGHLEETREAQAVLAVEIEAAREHLADLEQRRTVLQVVHEAIAETVAKLQPKIIALDNGSVGDHLDLQSPEREAVS